ncbi:5-(carboxyamino)imidazole ribonucleotide mutase [Clostridium grantii]|uniref:N5-carboxyaminoimidazole ribonucleotide mutase n=1 Tax=Clostridium grantii DSM 8605 TaxID=1121316 RepID=A0A1M5QG02_9CLOT|nr:5-(carboxyamino)imidazole ribonucleotide mutase [Clostridium grantii]SHH13125.1 5-(carboxyamino)imidazole ribonucleotide mutase [Clostridium grantii DSM 8605]
MSLKVSIIMGSKSDLNVMSEAAETLKLLNIDYEIMVVSAHRTPNYMYEYANSCVERGISVIIAGAGGAAHLPGMVASLTNVPVIGVPIKSSNLSGMDSLLSIAQMPPGVPVATMAINGSKNAALMAAKILAIHDNSITMALNNYKNNMEQDVLQNSIIDN